MKIALGLNIFKEFHRQDLCIESILRLKQQFGETLDLYNLQFKDENYTHPEFKTLHCLEKNSRDILGTKKKKPYMREFFDTLANLEGYDYFIFTNSDIIISDRYIKQILTDEYDCLPACRLAIEDLKTLSDPVVPIVYEAVGFDVYAVKNNWWKANKERFPDYIYAEPCWDVHYAILMKFYGKTKFVNEWPPSIFHIAHPCEWLDANEIGRQHNDDIFMKQNAIMAQYWFNYIYKYIFARTPPKNWYYPIDKEDEIENTYFENMKKALKM